MEQLLCSGCEVRLQRPPAKTVCEVCLLVVHRYQPGIQKLGTTPCEVEFLGRRDKPVKKMRLIPAKKGFAFARKLQGTPSERALNEVHRQFSTR